MPPRTKRQRNALTQKRTLLKRVEYDNIEIVEEQPFEENEGDDIEQQEICLVRR
jgi:hypothetical protein